MPGVPQQVGGPAIVTIEEGRTFAAIALGAALSTNPMEIATVTVKIFLIISVNPFK